MMRSIATVSTGTLASRLTGFLRDALIAALLGAGLAADAFLLAFQFVTVARRLTTEGALNAALVPQWLRVRRDDGEAAARAFAGRVLGTVGVIVLAATLALGLALPFLIGSLAPGREGEAQALAVQTGRLMLPYLAFAGPAAVLLGLFNAQGRHAMAAFSPLAFNLLLIAVTGALLAAGLADPRHAALILAAAIGIAGCLQLAAIALAGRGKAPAAPLAVTLDRDMRDFLSQAWPGMAASAGPQLLMALGAVLAAASPSVVAWLYFAGRLVELPLGLAGMNIGAVLVPATARAAHADDAANLARVTSRALELALALALPAAFALAVLAAPIVRALFEHGAFTAPDSAGTARALAVLALSLPAHVLIKTLSAVCFAQGDTRTPLHLMLIGLAAALALGLALPAWLGATAGIGAALTLAAWCNAALLGFAVRRRFGFSPDAGARRRLPAILFASLIMSALVGAAHYLLADLAAERMAATSLLGGLVVLGLVVYGALLRLFGALDAAALRRAWRDGAAP
ncbi:MAG: murein biosynthesis integral membrane protein MurJ [Xanthobacteraceae bacterium]|nr:MAG: murein biosynthesis integral membrane protein MurJ [Xanthobacteraceae bacterium]